MWNNDEVKENLLKLYDCKHEFTVTFSGKKSKNVNGVYKPATKEIILHNKNFNDTNNLLIVTAIHELAHHVIMTELERSKEGHTSFFWSTFYDLLSKAEKLGIYTLVISEKLKEKIEAIKVIDENISKLTIDMGKALSEMHEICKEENVRFEIVTERTMGIKRTTVKKNCKMQKASDLSSLSSDEKELVATINSRDKAQMALALLESGNTIDQVKQKIKTPMEELDEIEELEEKKSKLIHKIEVLTIEVQRIEKKLEVA